MDSWLRSSPHDLHRIYLSLILLILVFVEIPLSLCDDDFYSTCKSIFNCGNIRNVDFPFWGGNRPRGCGYPGLKLNCERSVGVATIEIMNVNYRVLDVDSNTQILKISREDYRDGICSPVYVNSTLDFTLFDFGPGYQNLTLYYGCRHIFQLIPWRISCDVMNGEDVYLELGAHGPKDSCNASVVVVVPIPRSNEIWNLSKLLVETIRDGIDVRWKVDSDGCKDCKESMGVCGYDLNSNRTTCYHSSSPGRTFYRIGLKALNFQRQRSQQAGRKTSASRNRKVSHRNRTFTPGLINSIPCMWSYVFSLFLRHSRFFLMERL